MALRASISLLQRTEQYGMMAFRNFACRFTGWKRIASGVQKGRALAHVYVGWWFPVQSLLLFIMPGRFHPSEEMGSLDAIRSVCQKDSYIHSAHLVPARVRLVGCSAC